MRIVACRIVDGEETTSSPLPIGVPHMAWHSCSIDPHAAELYGLMLSSRTP